MVFRYAIFLIFLCSSSCDRDQNRVNEKHEIEELFHKISPEGLKALHEDPVYPEPMIFQKSEAQKFFDYCGKRVKTLQLFLNDIYSNSENHAYDKINYIHDIFADIALQNGYWDGKTDINISTIFHDFLPYPINQQSFIYGCDIIKTKDDQYFMIEDSVTGHIGGLRDLPHFFWELQEKYPAFKKFGQYEKIESSIVEFIQSLKLPSNSPDTPQRMLLSYYNDSSSKLAEIFEREGYKWTAFTKSTAKFSNPNLLVNLTYSDNFDNKANMATFYHNLLLSVNKNSNTQVYYLNKKEFIEKLMDENRFKKERETIDNNNFLKGHSQDVKNNLCTDVNPLGATSMFDHKLYGIIADKLMELYLGEKPLITNPKTHFFFSYENQSFNQKLFDQVFLEGDHASWVVKNTMGVGGHGVYILKAISSSEIEELTKTIKKYPKYFFAQPFKELKTHKNLIYEMRFIALASPQKISFYPMPFVRGTEVGKKYKTNIGSGGKFIPAFVVD